MKHYSRTAWKSLREIAISAAVLGLMAPLSVSAQNLVTNAEFDHDVSDWQPSDQTVVVLFRGNDGSGLPGGSGPGCLEAQHSFWNGGSDGPGQVVEPMVAGATYTLEASYLLPGENNVADSVSLYVTWRDSDGLDLAYSDIAAWPVETDSWTRFGGDLIAPADSASAWVRLMVGNPALDNETRPGIVYFDDIWFAEKGTTTATQALFVPAAASVHGLAGTFWSTNGWFSSAIDFPVTLSGAFLRQGVDNSAALDNLTELGVIPPRGFLEIVDMAGALGATEEAGGIYLEATASAGGLPATLIYGTTYTFTPNPNGPGGYGQGLPAVSSGGRNMVVAPGIFQSAAFRTNVGALNTSAETVTIRISIYSSNGNEVTSEDWTLKPYEHRQKSVASMGSGALEGGTVVLTRISDGGGFSAYTSTVDQATGDAVYTQAR